MSIHICTYEVFMFFGVFIILAGILSLLESYGVIAGDVKWGLPLAVICFGASIVYDSIKKKNQE